MMEKKQIKMLSLAPPSLDNKSLFDFFPSLLIIHFFMSSENGEHVLDGATALAWGTCSECSEPQGKGT